MFSSFMGSWDFSACKCLGPGHGMALQMGRVHVQGWALWWAFPLFFLPFFSGAFDLQALKRHILVEENGQALVLTSGLTHLWLCLPTGKVDLISKWTECKGDNFSLFQKGVRDTEQRRLAYTLWCLTGFRHSVIYRNIQSVLCVCVYMSVHTDLHLLCLLREPRSSDTLVAVSQLGLGF